MFSIAFVLSHWYLPRIFLDAATFLKEVSKAIADCLEASENSIYFLEFVFPSEVSFFRFHL